MSQQSDTGFFQLFPLEIFWRISRYLDFGEYVCFVLLCKQTLRLTSCVDHFELDWKLKAMVHRLLFIDFEKNSPNTSVICKTSGHELSYSRKYIDDSFTIFINFPCKKIMLRKKFDDISCAITVNKLKPFYLSRGPPMYPHMQDFYKVCSLSHDGTRMYINMERLLDKRYVPTFKAFGQHILQALTGSGFYLKYYHDLSI